jgi:ABC-type sugar transport system permease subunit
MDITNSLTTIKRNFTKREITVTQRRSIVAWVFLLPALLILGVYRGIPIIWNFYLSFQERNVIGETEWVGLGHYEAALNDPVFITSVQNNLLFLGTIPVGITIALGLALLMDQKFPGNYVFRAIFFVPYITMMVAIGVIWTYMFQTENGVINYLLQQAGIIETNIRWLSDPMWARASVFIVHTWKSVGFYMIIILAGIQTIPQQAYEVARIDGADRVQRFFYITLPLLRPTLGICVLVGLTLSFELFYLIFVMTGGGPGNSTEILITYLYKNAFNYGELGYGAMITVALFALSLSIGYVARYYQRGDYR